MGSLLVAIGLKLRNTCVIDLLIYLVSKNLAANSNTYAGSNTTYIASLAGNGTTNSACSLSNCSIGSA